MLLESIKKIMPLFYYGNNQKYCQRENAERSKTLCNTLTEKKS